MTLLELKLARVNRLLLINVDSLVRFLSPQRDRLIQHIPVVPIIVNESAARAVVLPDLHSVESLLH